ncbi:MAG: RNA ligase family protein, partial [Candidatus Nanopelagicales bacterium]
MKLFDAVKPMLASAANEQPDRLWKQLGDSWVFEPKLDGFRCLVHADADRVILRSRNGNDITARFQHTSLPSFINPVVLDGELIAVDDAGKPAFNQVQRVQGKPGDPVASFVAFDILWDAGNGDTRRLPWATRREALDHYVEIGISVVPFSTDGPNTWAAA